jgi:glucose/arabinose dehydrogenase
MVTVTQHGKVFAFPNDPSADKTEIFYESPKLWFYSIYFHPKYAENHWVYIFANGPPDTEPNKKNRILRYVVKDGKVDPATEHLVIEWTSNGHDGGEMGFGPDGMLYITAGDGTTDSDRNRTGQDLSDLNSGVIRIDVEHPDPGRGYSIPKDNPFLSIPGARGELWAYGFRNPWRMTFDPKTGDLWVGDIGQDLYEMIEVVQKGDNYGWSVYEGGHPFHTKNPPGPTPVKTAAIVHPHSEARSITGGIVYTGPKYKDLQGAYLYGDYGTGKIWKARYVNGKITDHHEIADTPYQMLGFAQDGAGDIFIVDYAGQIYRLEPAPPDRPRPEFPRTLSASGVFTSVADYRLDPGLLPYSVNAPLWSDGAFKERHLGIPTTAASSSPRTGRGPSPTARCS